MYRGEGVIIIKEVFLSNSSFKCGTQKKFKPVSTITTAAIKNTVQIYINTTSPKCYLAQLILLLLYSEEVLISDIHTFFHKALHIICISVHHHFMDNLKFKTCHSKGGSFTHKHIVQTYLVLSY